MKLEMIENCVVSDEELKNCQGGVKEIKKKNIKEMSRNYRGSVKKLSSNSRGGLLELSI